LLTARRMTCGSGAMRGRGCGTAAQALPPICLAKKYKLSARPLVTNIQ
jgi:hypothetical protein